MSANAQLVRRRALAAPPRSAWSGAIWREIFIDLAQAGETRSVAESVGRGHSILVIPSIASCLECRALHSAAADAAQRLRAARLAGSMPAASHSTGRLLMPIEANFDVECQGLCDRLLLRQMALIRAELPTLVSALFDVSGLSYSTCVNNEELVFSEGEPALILYSPGSGFEPHEDGMALTCLLNVTSADDNYGGGGTAFWSQEEGDSHDDPRADSGGCSGDDARKRRKTSNEGDCDGFTKSYGDTSGDSKAKGNARPAVVIRPAAGTAILFGGNVTHAAVSVASGQRVVLVAGFSPMELVSRRTFEEAFAA